MAKSIQRMKALPPYFGGKRKLVSWIFEILRGVVPSNEWDKLTFIDAFCGGGAVSLFAKAQGFRQVITNDWSSRSQFVINGLLINQRVCLSTEMVHFLTQPVSHSGLVEHHFSPSVFSTRHAKVLDQLLYRCQELKSPVQHALGKLLIWHLLKDYVVMSTSIDTSNRPYAEVLDGLRDYQTLNPKRFIDQSFPKLLLPSLRSLEQKRRLINVGIFGGSQVTGYQVDATVLMPQIQGDILYLDPPYPNTLSYETTNRVLDAILTGEYLISPKPSPFTEGLQALEALLNASRHIPFWILSFNNKVYSLEELVSFIQGIVPHRTVTGYQRRYTHLAHVAQSKVNEEFVIIAY